MTAPAFSSLVPLNNPRGPSAGTRRVAVSRGQHRPLYYACQSQEPKPVRVESAPLARRDKIPSIFRGPEAVLGIVIAAAALLADFSRHLARLVSRPRPALNTAHDLDDSIALLSNALDASKAALVETESRLDESLARASSAESALLGIGDTREAMRRARETTVDADAELRRVTRLLAEQREVFEDVAEEKGKNAQKREEFEKAITERESEVEKLQALVAEAQATEEQIETTYKAREEEFRADMNRKQSELEQIRAERLHAEEQAVDLEARAATVAEQAEAAEFALEETRRELERVQNDLDTRQRERELVDAESGRADERSKETRKLRDMVRNMEQELSELQTELRSRDQVVNEFAMESDELRSLLHARDAELRDVSSRLDSAMTAETEKGGDPKLSEMSLNEIQSNLDAEKQALSAEIAKAELASFDITEADLDPLDRIKREMGAEENLFQAGLRKAESTVRLEEHLDARKEDAVGDVLGSVHLEGEDIISGESTRTDPAVVDGPEPAEQSEATFATVSDEAATVAVDRDSSEYMNAAVVAEKVDNPDSLQREGGHVAAESEGEVEAMVAKQALVKKEAAEAKPKKRRGRPPKKTSAKTTVSDMAEETKPKRKRGRPRKNASGDSS